MSTLMIYRTCCQRASRKDPEHFGPERLSRVLAMMKTASSIGMIIGPLLGGALRGIFGYDYMSWTWSVFVLIGWHGFRIGGHFKHR